MFKIEITDKGSNSLCSIPGYKGYKGSIVINDFKEHIDIQTGFWTKSDYIDSWKKSCDKLLAEDGCETVFFTQVLDPKTEVRNYAAECWSAYRQGSWVYVQMYYLPKLKKTNSVAYERYLSEQPREREKDFSEWKISLESVANWSKELKSKGD